MTKALLHNLGKSLSFGRLSLLGKVTWPMLLASSDDQGRGLAEADAVKWYVCPNVPELTQENLPEVLGEMVTQEMIYLYKDAQGRLLYQIRNWWGYQKLQWARPSKHEAPDGWTDRLRYMEKKQYFEENWNGKAGPDDSPPAPSPEAPPGRPGEALTQPNLTQPNLSSAPCAGGIQPEPTGEAALEAHFGKRPAREHTPPGRWSEKCGQPWRDWSQGHFREQQGVSVEAQNHVGWLVESITSLKPPGSNYRGWARGCVGVYNAGGGDWDHIEAGIRAAWDRESKFRPSTLACSEKTVDQNGFVKAVGKARADRLTPAKRSPLDAIPTVRAET